MKSNQHWHLFCLGTTWWTLFFILGLPSNYFQTSPTWIIILGGVILPTIALTLFGLRRLEREAVRQLPSLGIWRVATRIAFHMTVPLFIYDYLYLALHQQRGLTFLASHWYLTVFYIIPWLLLPLLAWITSRRMTDNQHALKGNF